MRYFTAFMSAAGLIAACWFTLSAACRTPGDKATVDGLLACLSAVGAACNGFLAGIEWADHWRDKEEKTSP